MTRPEIHWEHEHRPPPAEKVIALTRYGVLVAGPVTSHEWRTGFIVCWQRCPARPNNWSEIKSAAEQRQHTD